MEKIKRNYIGITLLCVSFILAFVDLNSSLISSFLGSLAFVYTNQITAYIATVEKKYAEKQAVYDEVERHNNTIFSKRDNE
ncbi:hypothetical protein [Pedobacter sp. SL55]|uniref:hypothetical protein n=1 Tax=Pedobacter sp. SL55 TaxID=2995161 RepID=UPI00226E9507|nr:hypothetical protein [Pedobacter sp. SL55]WAC41521.1 hypothetical protein OVA16_03920 [Pedobacter sp. SL55]